MPTSANPHDPRPPGLRPPRAKGAALLIALAFLVLLSAVVLALLAGSRTGRQSADSFATGQETLRLADTAVNLVQGQISDATSRAGIGWASQPGMVRAFDTAGRVTAHKLYSSDEMVVANYGQPAIDAEFTQIRNWNAGAAAGSSFNALFCDLNSPAVVERADLLRPGNTKIEPVFPITDPAAIGQVEGFSATNDVAGTVTGNGTDRRLPMPVRWLYILRDGQTLPASGGDANRAEFSGPVRPDASNPIVGRIAFWADDETCKLNINTAGEGTFWDPPKASTMSEVRMAISMPVEGEFQRMAGHPATTSLSPLLSRLSTSYERPPAIIDRASIASIVSNPDSYYENFVNYYELTPRIAGSTGDSDRSSKGGAQRTSVTGRSVHSSEVTTAWPTSDQNNTRKGAPLLPDNDRLYATPDEFLFRPDRSRNRDFSAEFLSRRAFFFTASSRAPETTIFGTPRIALWPQQLQTRDRNIKDRLLNFCSTVGGNLTYTYSFQRDIANNGLFNNPLPADSPTSDIALARNQKLITYLRNLGSATIPGFGGRFSAKWGADGLDQIIAQTFDTVRANTNTDYASLGNTTYTYAVTTRNPRAKLNPDANGRIIDNSGGPRNAVTPSRLSPTALGMGRSPTISQVAVVLMATKVRSTFVDAKIKLANGFDSTWSGTEEFDGENEPDYTPDLPAGASLDSGARPTAQETLEARAFLLFQPYIASQGTPVVVPSGQISVSGLNSFQVGTGVLGPSGEVATRFGAFGGGFGSGSRTGLTRSLGSPQVFANYYDTGDNRRYFKEFKNGGTHLDRDYPFVSAPIDVRGQSSVGLGGSLQVKVKSWAGEDLQSLSVDIPVTTVVVPQHIEQNGRFGTSAFTSVAFPNQNGIGTFKSGDYLSARKRVLGDAGTDEDIPTLIRPGDVVRAAEWNPADSQTNGDFRMAALTPAPNKFRAIPPGGSPAAYSGTSPSTANTASALSGRFAMSLRVEDTEINNHKQLGWKAANNGAVSSRTSADVAAVAGSPTSLLSGVPFDITTTPVVPAGLSAALMPNGRPGDWQSGPGQAKDGAFFTRPDAGNSNLTFGGYFGLKDQHLATGGETFEPNRMVPSAGVLGTLLSPAAGVLQPWQTLLFTPKPAAGNASDHPGSATPPDHLYLDNFWMPAIEPYPISEPLATAGKVNLNFQMLPFGHIERSTALRGALVPVMLSGVRNALASGNATYKSTYRSPVSDQIRFELDRDESIRSIARGFENGKFYRTATQIAEAPLVPSGSTLASLDTWWQSRGITSDTLREQPYTALLPRITTKSNTFTVHYRAQALRQVPRPGRDWIVWEEGKDRVAGEYRGSTTIERFLDPNTPGLPDYTGENPGGTYQPVDAFYRWRVISQKQFAP